MLFAQVWQASENENFPLINEGAGIYPPVSKQKEFFYGPEQCKRKEFS